MAQDVSKLYAGVINETGLTSSAVNGGAELLTGIMEAGQAKITASPVKTKNTMGEEIIVAYDLAFEAQLKQIKDYASIMPYNNQVTTVKLHNYGSSDVPVLKDVRINVGIDGDFAKEGGALIKLSATKRIESSALATYFYFETA